MLPSANFDKPVLCGVCAIIVQMCNTAIYRFERRKFSLGNYT